MVSSTTARPRPDGARRPGRRSDARFLSATARAAPALAAALCLLLARPAGGQPAGSSGWERAEPDGTVPAPTGRAAATAGAEEYGAADVEPAPAVVQPAPAHVQPAAADTAPPRVDLRRAVELFHRRGVGLRLARAEARRAIGRARQASAYPNPAVSVFREDLSRAGGDYAETTYSLEQTVEWPGRTLARSRAEGRTIAAARARFRADSLRLLHRVRRAYLRAAGAERRVEALERVADVVREAVADAEVRRREGDISGYDLRRLRLERARLEQALAAARIERSDARRALAARAIPESDTVALSTRGLPDGRPPVVARAEVLEIALERPGVDAARRALEAGRARARAARLERVPDLRLTGGYKTQSDAFDGPVLGLSVSLPVFDRKGGAVAAAEGDRRAAAERLRLERRRARNEVLRALDRYRSVRRRSELVGRQMLAPSEDLLSIARTAYDAGETDLSGLLGGADAWREARITAIELRTEIWGAWFDLLRAAGGDAGDADAAVRDRMDRDGAGARASGEDGAPGGGTTGGGDTIGDGDTTEEGEGR